MTLAVLGGSFNPVHNGHLSLARTVHSLLGYERVFLIPAASPPHKALSSGATPEQRLEMLRLAVAGEAWLEVDDCEIQRGGTSWTIETLRELTLRYSSSLEGKIGLVIGRDLASGFSQWRESDLIPHYADIILAGRPGGDQNSAPEFPHRLLANDLVDASSSDIRSRIREKASWESLVPEAVYRYILDNALYQNS